MIHSSEPDINALKQIRQDLYSAESTDENLKKIRAIEAQIKRHEAAKESEPTDSQKLEK